MSTNGSTNKVPPGKVTLLLLLVGVGLITYGVLQKKVPAQEPPERAEMAPLPQGWGWRNDGSGRFDKVNPVTSWSLNRNVKWKSPLDTWSNASPVRAAGHIFFCEEPNTLVAADASTGQVMWRRDVSYIDALPEEKQAAARAELAQFDTMDAELTEGRKGLAKRVHAARRGAMSEEGNAEILKRVTHLNELRKGVASAIRYRTPETNDIIGYTSSTPVTNGKAVYSLFANGIVAGFDMKGERLWAHWLGDPLTRRTGDHMNGYAYGNAASPILIGDLLVVAYAHLTALNARTGEVVWAATKMFQDFGTPFPMRVEGIDLLALPDGSIVRTSDGRTEIEDLEYTWYIGPTGYENKLFVVGSGSDEELLDENKAKAVGYELRFDSKGNLKAKELWRSDIHGDRYYATPLYYEGQVYTVSRLGFLVSIDAKSGRVKYEEKLPVGGSQIFSSPTAAGGNIFINTEMGLTFVVAHGPRFKLLQKNTLMPTRSSPFFHGEEMFVRTEDGLYAIKQMSK